MSRHQIVRKLVVGLLAAVAAAGIWLAHLGAFGGALFTDIPANAQGAQHRPALAAVIFSGDMGFRIGMGPRLGTRLANAGIPVTGVNSLVYFRQQRTADEVKHFIVGALLHALTVNHASKVVLIGQSFGADMLQIGLTGLPPDLRSKVAFVTLIVPTATIFYRISPAEMFELSKPDAPALETARQLTWLPVLCIYGVEEKTSLCPLLHQANIQTVALPGGHALHWDADRLFATINARLSKIGLT